MIPEESGASAGESCRSRHRSSASAAPRSALPRLRTRLAGSATARRRAGARPPPLRLLPCAPLDVGREDRFPLGTRLREDRARVVSGGARARSPFPGTPVAVTWDPRLKSAQQRAAPPPAAAPLTETTRCRRSRRRRRRRRLAPRLRHRRPPSRGGVPLTWRGRLARRRLTAAPLSPPLRSWPPPPLSIPPSAPPLPPPRASPPPPPPSPSPLSGAWRAFSPARPRCAHSLWVSLCTLSPSLYYPAVRTTAATASRLAAALPLAAERCLASLLTRRARPRCRCRWRRGRSRCAQPTPRS